jgi:hypothetical protein
LAVTLKAQVTKIKIDKLDYVKTENFFEYWLMQSTEWKGRLWNERK